MPDINRAALRQLAPSRVQTALVLGAGVAGLAQAFEARAKGHDVRVFEGAARVPMMARGPGVAAGHRVDSVTGLVDVAPTLLDMLGLEKPAAMTGESLLGRKA